MADQDAAAGEIAEARQKNEDSQGRLNGISDDGGNGLGAMPDSSALGAVVDVLDTVSQNAVGVVSQSDEVTGHIRAGDETGHFTEAENALQLTDHVKETSEGIAGIATEAKEKLVQAIALLDEVKLSLEQIVSAADEAQVSTGGTEDNLRQLAERLG